MLFSCLFAIIFTFLLCSVLKSRAYFFPIIFAFIIFNIQFLSLFGAISPVWILILNFILTGLSVFIWIKAGKPPVLFDLEKIKTTLRRFLNSLKLDKSLIFLAFGVGVIIIVNFLLCAFHPVNEGDAILYKSFRALVWADSGRIYHFDTNDARNLVMPLNSEMFYSWIYSFTKKDFGFGFLEFFAYLFSLSAISGLLERLKFSMRKRLWAIFIYSSFAWTILQISSTQSDLLIGLLVLYSIIFFYDWYKGKSGGAKGFIDLYFSALCFALSIGTKTSACFIGLPVMAFFACFLCKKEGIKGLLKFLGLIFVNCAVFSSYNYILNIIDYGDPRGSFLIVAEHKFYGGIKGYIANLITYFLQLFDSSGFRLSEIFSPFVLKLRSFLLGLFKIHEFEGVLIRFSSINDTFNEQFSGLGLTGTLSFIPCLFVSFFMMKKNDKTKLLGLLSIIFFLSIFVLGFGVGYMVHSIRFIGSFALVASPILVYSYFKKNNLYKTLIILISLVYFLILNGYNYVRPFYTLVKDFKHKNFEEVVYRARCSTDTYHKEDYKICEINEKLLKSIEEGAKVGFFQDEYPTGQLTKIIFEKKNVKVSELVLTRIENYDLKEFDYIILPPFQYINDFNRKDKARFESGNLQKGCYFVKNPLTQRVFDILCYSPIEQIQKEGFVIKDSFELIWTNKGHKHWAKYAILKNSKNRV